MPYPTRTQVEAVLITDALVAFMARVEMFCPDALTLALEQIAEQPTRDTNDAATPVWRAAIAFIEAMRV